MNQRSVNGASRGSEDLATLLEQGRRLQSEVVFQAFVRWLGLGRLLAPAPAKPVELDDCEDWVVDRP